MHRIVLNEDFQKAWAGRDPFEAMEALEGELFRNVKSRRTLRFEFGGKAYFIKIHHGVGWREIFKNWFSLKRPVLGASNEYAALQLLHEKHLDTMTACAFGERNWNPANRDSFLITAELADMDSLEDICRDWKKNPPPFARKCAILRCLARTVRTMHRAGLNHRDCYLCHFLLDRKALPEVHLYVIDLHRAEIRSRVPFRYLVKDVAGLYFSSLDAGLTRHDRLRFISLYGNGLREELTKNAAFWRDVDLTARKLYRKEFHREPENA